MFLLNDITFGTLIHYLWLYGLAGVLKARGLLKESELM